MHKVYRENQLQEMRPWVRLASEIRTGRSDIVCTPNLSMLTSFAKNQNWKKLT